MFKEIKDANAKRRVEQENMFLSCTQLQTTNGNEFEDLKKRKFPEMKKKLWKHNYRADKK